MITKLSISNLMENVISILCGTVPDLCDARVGERMMVERNRRRGSRRCSANLSELEVRSRGYICIRVNDIIFLAYAVPAGINIPEITGLAQFASFQTPFLCYRACGLRVFESIWKP